MVAATNQYLAMVSTVSVSFQFIYMGLLNLEYAALIGGFVALGSAIGLTQVNKIVKVTGRQSVIVMVLTGVLFISFFCLPLKYIFA